MFDHGQMRLLNIMTDSLDCWSMLKYSICQINTNRSSSDGDVIYFEYIYTFILCILEYYKEYYNYKQRIRMENIMIRYSKSQL